MSWVQDVALVVVAALGTLVVLTRAPLRQTVTVGVYGLALGVAFLTLGAPDVALAQIVVGGVALPVLVLLALARLREGDER